MSIIYSGCLLMHVEVPKSKKWKEFGGEYVMIVISILTALALEQGLETLHHRHLAHEAAEKMDAELRHTEKEVSAALEHNEKKRLALHDMRKQLLAAMLAKTSDAELMKRIETEWKDTLQLDLDTPGLRREAWEAAVANQAVTWMPREKLERYAGIYGAIRDTSTFTYGGTLTMLDMPHMMGVFSNVQMGVSNPQEIYRAASLMVMAYDNLDNNLKSLDKALRQVLAENGAGHAKAGS